MPTNNFDWGFTYWDLTFLFDFFSLNPKYLNAMKGWKPTVTTLCKKKDCAKFSWRLNYWQSTGHRPAARNVLQKSPAISEEKPDCQDCQRPS